MKSLCLCVSLVNPLAATAVILLSLASCKRDDMADQPKYTPLRPSHFYANNASARTPPEHTIPINAPLTPDPVSWKNPLTATTFPFEITHNDLLRGQQQFTVYCTPCHGILGDGNGMIPQRGLTRPPTFHSDRLRNAPPSYYYNVITLGIGAMFPYGDRVSPDDRWRIAAYIQALQLSQHAPAVAPSAVVPMPSSAVSLTKPMRASAPRAATTAGGPS